MNYKKILKLIKDGTIIEKGYRKIFKLFLESIFSKIVVFFPIKNNRLLFDNFGGKGWGDNPKYIAEWIHLKEPTYELIWLTDNLSKSAFPQYIKPVKIDSIKGLFMRATARVWVDNVRHLHPIKKRKGQIYIQTWHAPFSPKRLEADAEETLDKGYVSQAKYDGSICDAILANSKLQEEQYKRAFWLNNETEILRFGLPRNDYLISVKDNHKEFLRLREKFGFVKEDIYILYAPTFRDDMSVAGYDIDYAKIIDIFEIKTKKKCHIVVRFHPNVTGQSSLVNFDEHIINGTYIDSIQELSVACDYLISDYSTSLFDFVILNKPAFICALDLDNYKSMRGLLPEFDDFPFPKATTNSEFEDLLIGFDAKDYNKKIEEYLVKYPLYDKGCATKNTTNWILQRMEEAKKS